MTSVKAAATAVIVVDVQIGVVATAHGRDAVIANIAALVDRARAEGAPVVWVQHSDDEMPVGSPQWAIVPELVPAQGEPIVHKRYGDSFEDTDLADVLAGLDAGTLVIAGAQTDACIRSTLHGAFVRGYNTFLVSDAHTTEDFSAWGSPPPGDVITHTNLYWGFQSAPGRVAGVVTAAEARLVSDATP